MDKITPEDIHALYFASLCVYKGNPVKVIDCAGYDVTVIHLDTGASSVVKFKLEDFTAPIGRIGFVNYQGVALYITRMPHRQYTVGMKPGNTKIQFPEYRSNMEHHSLMRISEKISRMDCPEIARAIRGIYPGINDAIAQAVADKGACAFDRQFAVDYERKIYYKTKWVGSLPRAAVTLNDVKFRENYEYLQLPLLQHYEKTLRTFGAA